MSQRFAADELTAAGKTGEEIAADLGISAATLYNWRRQYGGLDTDAAKELKELREQNHGAVSARCPRRSAVCVLPCGSVSSPGLYQAERDSNTRWTQLLGAAQRHTGSFRMSRGTPCAAHPVVALVGSPVIAWQR
ncbi:transposase [Nocardia sp. NBC_01329]|uniref:transposase n=1 Tax=Nocardia sp. NBC_01329 TaxID=2903594 RepID=UPI003FA36B0A